jgi:predicted CXXCH cytochrome family protein
LRVKNSLSPVSAANITKTCAACHSNADYMKLFNPGLPVDQYEKYLTSVHGKKNAQGDVKVATCVSCHSNHLVYPVKDPRSPVSPLKIPGTCATCHNNAKYMAEYKIPTNQYDDYVQSVHGIALLKKSDTSAPACNSCHGNHGAAPPGVETVAAVCGQCHQANAELYDKSVHHAVFQDMSLPGCVVCHSNHKVKPPTDDMIGFHAKSICGSCHSNTPTDKAAPVIQAMQTTLKGLTKGQEDADQVLTQAEQLGMDVAEAKYTLKDVNQSLIEARVKVHSFQKEPVQESAAPGLKVIAQAKSTGQAAIKEYYFRRKGLGVSTLLLTCVVVLLYLKIRQIEGKQQ